MDVLAVTIIGALIVVGAFMVFTVSLWMGQVKRVREERNRPEQRELEGEARTLIAGIRKSFLEIEAIVESKKQTPLAPIGEEAVNDARSTLLQCIELLERRAEIKKRLAGKYEIERSLKDVQKQLETEQDAAVRTSLQAAVDANERSLEHYHSLDQVLSRIQGALDQAAASLSETRARLSRVFLEAGTTDENLDALRESLGRLKAMDSSIDEVKEFLTGGPA